MSKTIYVGVNSVARKVKQPYVGVGNVARKVKSGFVGVNGVARQFFSGGTPISSLAIGSTLYLNENGSPIPYLVVHQGKPSSIYDDSCNGTWLLRTRTLEMLPWAESYSNVVENSYMHSWLNSTMLAKYDANIKNVIKQVKIPYRANGGSGGSTQTGANGLSCKVFLLSGYEVGFTTSDEYSFPVDGAKLDYFLSGTKTDARQRRYAYYDTNDITVNWWTRSPVTSETRQSFLIDRSGNWSYALTPYAYNFRPALIMPSDTPFNTSTYTIIT